MWIFPENLATFEYKKNVEKNLEEIFANILLMLTSEAMVLNPKACGVHEWNPSGGCGAPRLHKNEGFREARFSSIK